MAALSGTVAVVAGATRGAGRGIAAALGEAGATVVCTGRTTRSGMTTSDYGRTETIEETAELVTALGGTGVAIPVDHLDREQVARLADTLRTDFGAIDVLVNDIWGGELLHGGPAGWDTPLWQLDLDKGFRMLRLAIDTHVITSHHLLPLLLDRPGGGLVVEVTDGTTDYNASRYRISVFYDLCKVAVNRLAFSQGHELAPHDATAVAVTPGWMRSEMMLEAMGVTEENWRDGGQPGFAMSETPRYVGAGSPRSRPIRTVASGTSARPARPSWPGTTASPTWTAPAPTSGPTTRTARPTRPATARSRG